MIINNKDDFADMMLGLLVALGYRDVKKNDKDNVVSILAKKDGQNYAFACQYNIDAINKSSMEDFAEATAHSNIDVAVFMTNSSFSTGAKKIAEAARIQLWDRNYIDRISIGVDISFGESEKYELKNPVAIYVVAMVVGLALIGAGVMFFFPSVLDIFTK